MSFYLGQRDPAKKAGVHQKTLNRLVKFIEQFKSLNFANDAEMEEQLENVRKELLSKTAPEYRDDASAHRSIVIIIGSKGEILIEGVGFKGSSCEKAIRYIEEALGAVWHRVKKPEFSQSSVTSHQQEVGA